MRNELITFTDPKSPVSEMFRTLRTNLQFMGNSRKIQTVLITSTMPGEGKSWTTANLAVTFAQAGKKVVIVDSDLRRGRQFSIFNVVARPGLSNYLSGVVNEGEVYDVNDIRSFIRETDVEDLYVIPAGDVPPNPSELLINNKMNKLISDLKEQFDIVIFDAPPTLLVTDATILARMVDTSMIVAAHQETKMDNLNKVQRAIKNVGGNIAGVVINKIPISAKKYQNGYYGGYYGSNQEIVETQNTNQDLYLRGKATILDDRSKKKETKNKTVDNYNTNLSQNYNTDYINQEMQTEKIQSTNSEESPMKQTEEMLRKMNNYIEEQKRQMNNQ